MSTLTTTFRNSLLSELATLIGSGATLKYYNSGGTLLVTIPLNTVPFGTPVSGSMTANTIAPATVTAAGTVATARLVAGTGVEVLTAITVGTSGTEIVMSPSLVLAVDDIVDIGTFTIGMPA